jgi:hypothetical protein
MKNNNYQIEMAYAIAIKDVVSKTTNSDLSTEARDRHSVSSKMAYVLCCDMLLLSDRVIADVLTKSRANICKYRENGINLLSTNSGFYLMIERCEDSVLKHFNGVRPSIRRKNGIRDRKFKNLFYAIHEAIPDSHEDKFEIEVTRFINSFKEKNGLSGRLKIRPYKLRNE